MNILLIFPRIEHGVATYHDRGSWGSILYGYPAITLPHLAAITPQRHSVEIINENYDDIDFDQNVDLVGITCLTMTAPRVYEIADEFRRRGKTVVLGGYHPSALPEEAKQHADSVVIGEAEPVWSQLLQDHEKGKLKPFYHSDEEFDMSIIPPIRRDLIRHMPILGGVQSTRGCPNRCEFCAITSFYKHGVKQRPIKNVVEEIKQMPNKFFILHDPSLTINPRYARELFKTLIREKVKKGWVANGNANVLAKIDEEFLRLARKSGCIEWFVGFESISQAALNGIKKTCNRVEDFEKMIRRVHKHGMTVQGGIIFGFDEDTPDIFDTTLEKIYEWELDVLEVNILTPFPGTPLFDRLEREGRITTKDWSRYNQIDVVFKPKNMTEKELREGARKVAKNFYSIHNIIPRIVKTMWTAKKISGILPAGTNFAFRKYYKRDFNF
ncbi:MAG: B12-binding domain-containing radical SAM protein [Thermoplasmata archaeon]|nr:MAG: B12-binding domain-containing radical SAM protein [Thermoplasmata archaeon]